MDSSSWCPATELADAERNGTPASIRRRRVPEAVQARVFSRSPRRCPLFPLVVSELLDARSVVPHDEDFAVRLRRIRIDGFVLEPHARAGEHDVLAVGRPSL